MRQLSGALGPVLLVPSLALCLLHSGCDDSDPTPAANLPEGVDVALKIDASKPGDVYHDILDEINTWKMYAAFSEKPPSIQRYMHPGWLKAILPWIEYARTPAALGGNFGPSIAEFCDERVINKTHPADTSLWECGRKDGGPGLARRYEIARQTDSGVAYDFSFFDSCLARLLQSGLKPHLNISSANELFTGEGHFHYYHWNENPVTDFEGWLKFVRATFEHLNSRAAQIDISEWRFSCINEPNCEKRDKEGIVQKVGYNGDEHQYAKQYTQTIKTAREVVPNIRFQMGNYVIRPDFMPPIRTLDVYLNTLREAMIQEGLSFEELRFQSLSMYEVPFQSIYGSTATRFAKLRRWIEAADIPLLPFKIDEFEIHAEIKGPFDREHELGLDTTYYASSWMAKAVKAFQEQGVVSAACWWTRLGRWKPAGWRPYPKYYVCAFYPLLSGRISLESEGEVAHFLPRDPGGQDPQWRRLALDGELLAEYEGEDEVYRSLEAIATREDDTGRLRLLVFHHDTEVISSEEVQKTPQNLVTRITLRGMDEGSYALKGYFLSDNESLGTLIRWDREKDQTSPFLSTDLGTQKVDGDGELAIEVGGTNDLVIPRHSVLMFEISKAL